MLKTAIYGLLRVTFDLIGTPLWWWGIVALGLGLASAVFGIIFAAVQTDMKRLLAYSSIENIGLIVAGFGLTILFHGFSMGSLAASGGYYVSCGATTIVANPGTLTGSIGVISQFMNFDSLMQKVGVGVNTIKSGRFKDAGNPFRAMSPEDVAYFQGLMDDVHRQFIATVEHERKIPHDTLVTYADGRVFTGEQARTMGLVDTIGTYEDAVEIAAHLGKIDGEPAIVKERKHGPSLFERLFGEVLAGNLEGVRGEFFHRPILQYRMVQGF